MPRKAGLAVVMLVLALTPVVVSSAETAPVIYIAMADGLRVSTDGGEAFALSSDIEEGQAVGLLISDGMLFVGTASQLSVSADYGASFTTRTSADGVPTGGVRAMALMDGRMFIGTGSNYIAVSEDGGATFVRKARLAGWVSSMFVFGETLYVATGSGLFISTDGGDSYATRTVADGLGSDLIYSIAADDASIYLGTRDGLSISTDGGATFANRTTDDGLCNNRVNSVWLDGETLYVGTRGGLNISHDGGETFEARRKADGLAGDRVSCVMMHESALYVVSDGGLSISYDTGDTFVSPENDGYLPVGAFALAVQSVAAEDTQQ